MKSHLAQEEKDELEKNVIGVAELAGHNIKGHVEIVDRECPHSKPKLPEGKKAIYLFRHNKEFLKIGMITTSKNRFEYQHYNPDGNGSTLAKSILEKDKQKYGLTKENVGDWILNNVHRVDILIDDEIEDSVVKLLESFLQCKHKPRYEG